MTRTVLAVVGVVFLFSGEGARAHHSYAGFADETVSVQGTLETVEFASPHSVLTFRAKDSVLYTAIWRAAFQLDTMGVSRTALRVGDVIVVTGTPSKDPALHELARWSGVRRPGDGWEWQLNGGRASVAVAG
jgi:hypothetical protein